MKCYRKSLRNNRYWRSLSDNNGRQTQTSTINITQNKVNKVKTSYGCYLQKLSDHHISKIKNKSISISMPKYSANNNNNLTSTDNNYYSQTNNLLTRVRVKQPRLKQNRQRRVRTQYGGEQSIKVFQHDIGAIESCQKQCQQQQQQQQSNHNIKTVHNNNTTPLTTNHMISTFTNPQQKKRYKSLNNHQPLDIYLSSIKMNYHKRQQVQLQGELGQSRKMEVQNRRVNQNMNKRRQGKKIDNGRRRNDKMRRQQQTYQSDIIKSKLKLTTSQNISPHQQLCPKPLSDYSSTLTDPHFRSNTLIQASSLYTLAAFYKRKSKQRQDNRIVLNKSKNSNKKINNNTQHNKLFIPSLLVKDRQQSLTVFDNLMRNIESGNKCKKGYNKCKNHSQNNYSRQSTIIEKKQQKIAQTTIKHQFHQTQNIKKTTAIKSSQQQQLISEQIDMKSSQRKTHIYHPLSIKKQNPTLYKKQMKYDEWSDKIGKIVKQEIHDDKTEILYDRQENADEGQKITIQQNQQTIQYQKLKNIYPQENKDSQQFIFVQQQQQNQHQTHQEQHNPIIQQPNNNLKKQVKQNHQSTPQSNQQLVNKGFDDSKLNKENLQLNKENPTSNNQNNNCSIY